MDKEEKRLRSVIRGAAFLQNCFPPHKQAGAARSIAKIAGPQPDAALLEILLEGSTQRLTPASCPNPSCCREFLFAEINRDGDSYRCVWCNKNVFSNGAFSPPAVPLSKSLRALEKQLNVGFFDYTKAYFGTSALCNVYVALPQDVNDVSCISVAVLIRRVADVADGGAGAADSVAAAAAAAAASSSSSTASVWNSSHTIVLQLDRDYQIDVAATSTIYIESHAKPCRFSGHVSRPTKKFAVPIPGALHATFEENRTSLQHFVASGGEAAKQLVVSAVGDLVQQVENRLRDVTASVYFGKCGQVSRDLRCPVGRTDATQARMSTDSNKRGGSVVPAFPQVDASGLPIISRPAEIPTRAAPDIPITAAVPLPPKKKAEPVAVVVVAAPAAAAAAAAVVYVEDVSPDDGSVSYYNEETGEYLEEGEDLPEGAQIKQAKKDKKDKKSKKDKKAAAAAAQEEAEEGEAEAGEYEWTIAAVLAGLELADATAEEYAALFEAAGVATVEEMLVLGEKDLKKTIGITSSSDRKVISAWIDETYAAATAEE